jgi:colanic acid/amylovoran biosynthesis protein WcaK/AmsJ
MTTIYLTGHYTLSNRGCEALVRSTVTLLRQHLDRPRILVPSSDIPRDSVQWPDAADEGVEFVAAPKIPYRYLSWTRLCRRLPLLTRLPWPPLPSQPDLAGPLSECDAVLSIGGDMLSLDYGLDSPFFFVGIAESVLRMGKPVILWGASVGPFSALPGVERQMTAHLRHLSLVTIRESHTLAYLRDLGVSDNVLSVTDSAFVMQPQEMDLRSFWPTGHSVLGLNMSPIVESVRKAAGSTTSVFDETVAFVQGILSASNLGVLLVPHVAPLDGSFRNSDERYLAQIAVAVGDAGGRVRCVPSGCNAPQLKYVISRCRYFIGARTHATIAAFSTGVPTISIAYSVKARGINRDLFGDERYVLDTREVSADSLAASLSLLDDNEKEIRHLLAERIPVWRERAAGGARALQRLLSPSPEYIPCA